MTPLTLRELSHAGVTAAVMDGRLCLSAPAGQLPPDLRDRIAANRDALLAALTMRAHLTRLADAEGLPADLVDGLSDADVDACAGLTVETLEAYLRVVHRGRVMDAGMVPAEYANVARCDGCGPVWLWTGAPSRVVACPWCFRRKAGRSIPAPTPLEVEHG